MTVVHLEFRDEELHFDNAYTLAATSGHQWESSSMNEPCTHNPDCEMDASWQRWTVAHPNVANMQMLCPEHAYEVAKATPSLRAVICARDPHDEFNGVLWEQDVQADFPIY